MVDKKKVNKRVIQITDGVLASSLRNDLGEYLITIERLLEEQKPGYEYFEGQLDEYAKRDAPNEEELYKQVFYEDQHRYTEEFPRLLYNS